MFAAILYAGLYGIQNKIEPVKNIEVDSYTKKELIDNLKGNEYFTEKLGTKIIDKAIKKLEIIL